MKSLLAAPLLLALFFCAPFSASAAERMVSIYGWGDYMDPKVIEDFTKETGIIVTYDTYDSAAALEKRIAAGGSGFDVVIVPGEVLRHHLGLFQKLDKTRLAGRQNLLPEVMARLAAFDPGNQVAVSYLWFTAGLIYNADKVNEALGGAEGDEPPAAFASWATLFQFDTLKKLASCGVSVPDSAEEMFAAALIYLKGDPSAAHWSYFKHASDLLGIMRRNVKKFDSMNVADDLASGEICLAVGTSQQAYDASERAQEAGNGIEIGYAMPKEGPLIGLDSLAILKDAPHSDEAYVLIDFVLRPEIAARNTNFTHLASGVGVSGQGVNKEIAGNSWIYPPAGRMTALVAVPDYDAALLKSMEHEWARIKAGK